MGFGLRTSACEVPSKQACRLCDALLFPSLLVPSLLRAATRFSGTAFGLRPALAKSRRNGKPTRRRSEGARFLNRLECRPALAKSRRSGQPTRIRSEGARIPEISLVPPGACEVPSKRAADTQTQRGARGASPKVPHQPIRLLPELYRRPILPNNADFRTSWG